MFRSCVRLRASRRSAALALGAGLALMSPPRAPAQEPDRPPNTLTEAERAAGWRLLFDGRTTAGWRGYMKDHVPEGWQAVDGALTRTGPAGDLITVETFRNFELRLEWTIAPGGNSGIFYRGIEGPAQLYFSAPELQVLDDAAHADGRTPLTSAGANYGLHPVPPGVSKPAGEWNTVRVLVDGDRVEHWLNGVKVVEYELGSPDWEARVAASKFRQWPEYGRVPEGHIGLQDHGDRVSYRNIRIRTW